MSHRMILAARYPTEAPDEICNWFTNGIALFDSIRIKHEPQEKKKNEVFEITDWLFREDGNKRETPDILLLHLQPTYKRLETTTLAPTTRKRVTRVGTSTSKASSDSEDVDMDKETLPERAIGYTYESTVVTTSTMTEPSSFSATTRTPMAPS
ncbi:hypothetical protein DFH07DRAFT_936696 [Mycena maculata]|uniref:Uncharacterized protein n=1 Tax=Mycena maculata TaxID=230809 RepID=A0AAD7K885_9AGAR|nr:hypothetical protein DFH07DRAFT_936696 [Mycena maculata]